MTLTGAAAQPRTCAVCGWRELAPHRPHVCERCETDIRAWLEELADHADVIGRSLAELTAGRDGTLPIRTPVLDLVMPARSRPVRSTGAQDITRGSIASDLGWWVIRWSEIAPAIDLRPSNSVGSIALWLWEQLHWACVHNAEVREMGQTVRDLLAETRRALNLTAPAKPGKQVKTSVALTQFTAPCIRCGGTGLFAHQAASWIECPDCGSLYSDDEYGDLARAELPDDTLLWAVQASTALGVPVQRIWQWASRGALEEVDHEGGRPRYRLGDLRDVHRQTELHRAGRCEIGLLTVQADGSIKQGPLVELAAPATVAMEYSMVLAGGGGGVWAERGWATVTVRRGQTRWIGPAAEGAIVVQEAGQPARVREVASS